MTESLIQLPTAGEPVIDTFDRMIRTGPIVPYELPGGVRAWMAVSHQAVSEVLAGDGTVFSKSTRNCPAMHDGTVPADWPLRVLTDADHLLNKDGADHLRMRRAIARAFTPARVAQLEPRIQQLTNDLIDNFADQLEVDLVDNFTMPLPVGVICELFGVPMRRSAEVPRLDRHPDLAQQHGRTDPGRHAGDGRLLDRAGRRQARQPG